MHLRCTRHTAATIAILAAAALISVRLAWVGDDTWITLRTVENVVDGHGPVWNVGERVQTYTHPLWMLMLCGARLATGEPYFGTVALSLAVALLAAFAIVRHARTAAAVLLAGALLVLSRSYVEYAVSGLENPLSFLLLALLAHVHVRAGERSAPRRAFLAALLTALAALTRLDLALLGVPAMLAAARGMRTATWLSRTALGLLPLAGWLAFATVYYGTPLPITAYAKIGHGVPAIDLLRQGGWYLLWVAQHDPLTLAVLAAGIAVGLLRPALGSRALALGALLYLGYVVKVGGDFMGGRFLTPPFVVAVVILARAASLARVRTVAAAIAVASLLAFAPGVPPWLRAPGSEVAPTTAFHGILDERSYYYGELGLLSPRRRVPEAGVTTRWLRQHGRQRPVVAVQGKIGVYAFEGGELMNVVDPWLCDPLLMRLPVGDPGSWRIGHFARHVPAGYLETIAFGGERIHHAGLARYHAALHTALHAPLFAGERWRALWRLWSGALDDDLAAFVAGEYRTPPRDVVAAGDVAQELPPTIPGIGPLWFDDERARVLQQGGLEVRFAAPVTARALQLQLGGELEYRVRCLRGDDEVAAAGVDTRTVPQIAGLAPFTVALPPQTTFDRVLVDVVELPSHLVAVLGSLRVIE